jgi:hypothetical protein
MFQADLREEISQGDLFSRVPFVEGDEESFRRAVLLTHDCQFDKVASEYVLLAWVRPLVDLEVASQGNARSGRIKSAIYVPEGPPVMSESFIDLTRIAPIRKDRLIEIAERERVASMTDEARLALALRIAIFFGR